MSLHCPVCNIELDDDLELLDHLPGCFSENVETDTTHSTDENE